MNSLKSGCDRDACTIWHIVPSLLAGILPQEGGSEGFFYSFNACVTGEARSAKSDYTLVMYFKYLNQIMALT